MAVLMTKAIAEVGNRVVEQQLLERAHASGLDAEGQSDEQAAVRAVADYHRERSAAGGPLNKPR
jgi:hypothetical protein